MLIEHCWVIKIQQADSKPIQKHVPAQIPPISLDVEDKSMLAVQDIKIYFKFILIKTIYKQYLFLAIYSLHAHLPCNIL